MSNVRKRLIITAVNGGSHSIGMILCVKLMCNCFQNMVHPPHAVSNQREQPSSKPRLYGNSLAEILGYVKPEKVFILAGLMDVINVHIDRADRYVDRIMALAREYDPGVQVYFFSMTPVTKKADDRRDMRESIDDYNVWLAQKCAEAGAVYVEIAASLKGEDGLLPGELSHDGLYHLNDAGNARWVRALLDFAQAQYDAGAWTPEDGEEEKQ